MRVRIIAVVATGAVCLTLTVCGGSSDAAHAPTTTAARSSPTTKLTAIAPIPTDTAKNLVATAKVKVTLLQVGAAARSLRPKDFTGLTRGKTYYAFDKETGTYWAGAQLSPSASSMKAQVSSQDDGAYTLFEKAKGTPWQVYDVGLISPGKCAVVVPPAILKLWGWPRLGCRPRDI